MHGVGREAELAWEVNGGCVRAQGPSVAAGGFGLAAKRRGRRRSVCMRWRVDTEAGSWGVRCQASGLVLWVKWGRGYALEQGRRNDDESLRQWLGGLGGPLVAC